MDHPRSRYQLLVSHVATRLTVAGMARSFSRWFVTFAVVIAAYVLVQRLLGLGPELAPGVALVALPLASVALAVLRTARADDRAAARRIDAARGTKELFLTRSLLDGSPDGYSPLVVQRAEAAAARVDARAVVPFVFVPRTAKLAGALAVLVLLFQFVPDLGLLSDSAEQAGVVARRKELAKHKLLAKKRVATLKRNEVKAAHSPDLRETVRRLTDALQKLDKKKPNENKKRISEQQRTIGQQWRKAARSNLAKNSAGQRLGHVANAQDRRWRKQLTAGDASGLEQELRRLKQQAADLGKTAANAEAQKKIEKMLDRLQALSDFARTDTGSPELSEALARLMQELQTMQLDGVSEDALAAFRDNLDLSALELDALAQSMRDLNALEQALETLRLAKMLDKLSPLDGEASKSCNALGDYEKLYRAMLAKQGERTCEVCGGGG